MLRVKTEESIDAFTFRLEGRLTGEEAEQVRKFAMQCHSELRLVVDLTEVMFIDAVGEEVLSLFKRLGADFVSETAYSRDICERLQLPLIDQPTTQALRCDGNGHRANSDSRRR
jgi:hypothetical protein